VVRDLPLADRPVVLVWAKRLWRRIHRHEGRLTEPELAF
jgi:hypothetical protein